MTRFRLPRWLALPGVALAALLAGCGQQYIDTPQSTLDPAGPVAQTQFGLFVQSALVMTGIFVIVMAMLIYVLIRYKRRRNQEGDPVQVHGNRYLELTWTIIPILILVYLAWPSVKVTWALAQLPSNVPVMHVDVTGHQFWWEFKYDDGPAAGVVTANELHVPAGTYVDFNITSADVIHSFWLPRLGGKVDAIPGRINHLYLEADNPGIYPGQCSQLCGDSHAYMGMAVYAQTPSDFKTWAADMKKPYQGATSDLAKQGMQIFANSCQSCHTIDGTAFKGTLAPNLSHLMLRKTIAAYTLTNDTEDLTRWVSDAPSIKPGIIMPVGLAGKAAPGEADMGLSPDQVKAVVAFLQTLN